MSSEDKIREFEESLPFDVKKRIDSIVDQIRQQMDDVVKREDAIDKLIQKIMDECDRSGKDPDQTSRYLKHKLEGIISKSTIQRYLPKERKRKYERYYELEKSHESFPIAEIELSTSGKVTSDKPISDKDAETVRQITEIPPNEEILETAIDMSMAANEKSNQIIKELNALVNQKQDEIEKLILKLGELEFQVKDSQKVIKEIGAAHVKDAQGTDTELSEYKEENRLLKEALRKKIKTEAFMPASDIEEPKTVWIAALNCFGLSRSLMQLSMKLTDDSSRGKVLFDIATDGSIKNPRLEAASVQEN